MTTQQPYPPGTWVFFTEENGVKQGKVLSITITISDKGKDTKWNIAETNRVDDGNIETTIYHKGLDHIAIDWANILEKAEKNIFAYHYAAQEKKEEEKYVF